MKYKNRTPPKIQGYFNREKAFDKNPTPTHDKNSQQTRKRHFLNLIKGIYKNIQLTNIILNSERLNALPLRLKTR